MASPKSKFWSRIAYACGTFGHDVFYMMLATYFMIFVTSNLFHSDNHEHDAYMIGIVTTIILVLRIAELFIDPFIGNTIDKTKTRWGKFKPWVIVGAFVAAISLAILFTDMGGLTVSNPMLYLVLFALIYLIMDVFYSAKDVAIWSMIPALSFDSHEREITATYARIGSVFGAQMITAIVMPVVLYFSLNENGGAGDGTGWFAFAVIGGGIATLGAVILGLGQNLVNNFNLYYFIYVLGDAKQFSFLGVINVIIGLLAVALFPTLTMKFSRRRLFFGSVSVMLIGIILYALAGTSVIMTLFAAGLFALPQPLIFLVVLMTITDTVEYGQLKLGHRDEALVLCVRPLVDKLAGAVTGGLIGITAIWVGMTSGATAATITPENLFNFKLVMFAAPFALILIGTVIYRAKVTLTEAEHARIVEELEDKWHEMNQ